MVELIAGRKRSTRTRKGTVRLFGNTEYRKQRDLEQSFYDWVGRMMREWGRRHATVLRR